MTDKELEAIVSSIEGLSSRLDALDEALSESSTEEVNRTRRQAARERRLLQDEVRSSEGVSARAAEELMRSRDALESSMQIHQEAIAVATKEIEKKEASARSSQVLAQSQLIDLQEEISEAKLALNELQQGHLAITQDEAVIKSNMDTVKDAFDKAKDNVNRVAADAAARAVDELNQQAIKEEIQRQLRLQQEEKPNSGASS